MRMDKLSYEGLEAIVAVLKIDAIVVVINGFHILLSEGVKGSKRD